METPHKDKRRKQMYALIDGWKGSGMSIVKYCKDHQLAPSVFHFWHKRYKQERGTGRPGFIPVRITGMPGYEPNNIQITYPNGVCIYLPAGLGIEAIKALVNY